jgi:hypothetical protein
MKNAEGDCPLHSRFPDRTQRATALCVPAFPAPQQADNALFSPARSISSPFHNQIVPRIITNLF